jgi:LuxR family maltose regulon positive regulatory protein
VSAALLIDRAMLRRAAGDLAAAERALMQARAIIDGMVDPGDMRERLELERALLGDGRPSPASLPAPGLTFYEPLSPREQEVLRLLRSEYSLPEIAGHLFVSYNTAKTHTKTIYRKLGVRTRSSAVARARDLGYLDRPREKLTSH